MINADSLRIWLQSPRITGICSVAPQSGWGTTLGPELIRANHDRRLQAAWSIDEMRVRPSAETVRGLLIASTCSFSSIFLFAMVLVWKTAPRRLG